MFAKLAVVFVASMAAFVAAAPGGINNSCNTGAVQCCNSLYKSDAAEWTLIKSIVGVEIPVNTMVGAQCSPLSVIGVGGGSSCQSQPVCCSNNKFNGLIVVGCSPINVNI